ncbi:MAG TPA: hypothetical protein VGK50_09055 [Coriobacteriia bacterium]
MSERSRRLRKRLNAVFGMTAVLYVLLGVALSIQAVAQQRLNPVVSEVGNPTTRAVPSGSDDASVKAFYHYLDLRHFMKEKETYVGDPETAATYYGLVGVAVILFYYFTFAWYARLKSGDLYPVEVYNGYIAERGGPVDPFNWATYAILLAYMVYYTVVNIVYGQMY